MQMGTWNESLFVGLHLNEHNFSTELGGNNLSSQPAASQPASQPAEAVVGMFDEDPNVPSKPMATVEV
jgi:hypothetical protein